MSASEKEATMIYIKIDNDLLTIIRNNCKKINIETSKNPNRRDRVSLGIGTH